MQGRDGHCRFELGVSLQVWFLLSVFNTETSPSKVEELDLDEEMEDVAQNILIFPRQLK